MMKFLMICAVALTTTLGGCASTGGTGGGTTQTDIQNIIAQVQANTRIACGFVPTVTTILNIIGTAIPAVGVATSIAAAICAAVAPPMMAGRKAFVSKTVRGYKVTPGAVNGVQIEGSRG